jgi:hypothetical protein
MAGVVEPREPVAEAEFSPWKTWPIVSSRLLVISPALASHAVAAWQRDPLQNLMNLTKFTQCTPEFMIKSHDVSGSVEGICTRNTWGIGACDGSQETLR